MFRSHEQSAAFQPVATGLSQEHDVRFEDVGGVGAHYWLLDRAIPFGGHWLIECSCGCFGPFVLSVEDAERVQCAVALAWREGSARRSVCGDVAPVDLRERDRLRHER